MMETGLRMYSWMGGRWHMYETLDPMQVQMMSPGLSGDQLTGGFRFYDAQTDDARLVLRVLREGGYEADTSMIYYGQPGPFTEAVEETVIAACRRLLDATALK